MKKVLYTAALAALALTSCQTGEMPFELPAETPVDTLEVADSMAIAFDLYQSRSMDSRGVANPMTMAQKQSITTRVLQACDEGFGVFAFETGPRTFSSVIARNIYPDFMFNQQVTWRSTEEKGTDEFYENGEWEYTPVKYWPNDDSFITFQAYAPWCDNFENFLYDVKYQGVGIRYDVDQNYDLLWGAKAFSGDNVVCFYDQLKPSIMDKTRFQFKHALTKVDFTVSYNADDVDCTDAKTDRLDVNTKIIIRSIKLLGTLPSQGVLSLYDGAWTVEKTEADRFQYGSDFFGYTNKIGTLNGAKYVDVTQGQQPGVLTDKVPRLYANSSVMLIPAESDVRFEISYDVVTTDPLGQNSHTKNITITSDKIPSRWGNSHAGNTGTDYAPETGFDPDAGAGADGRPGIFHIDAGKWTTINIHLGMTSVKFDASVEKWDASESGAIDMPANKE